MTHTDKRNSITSLFLLIFTFALFSIGFSDAQAETIVGLITECTVDGSPIAGVEVIIDDEVLGTTDENGNYEVNPGAQDIFDVFYSKPGYIGVLRENVRVGGQPVTVDVVLESANGHVNRDFIEIQVPIGANEDSTAEARVILSNTGCGQLHWNARMNIVETPWFIGNARQEENPDKVTAKTNNLTITKKCQIKPKSLQDKFIQAESKNSDRGPVAPRRELDAVWDQITSFEVGGDNSDPLKYGVAVTSDFIYVSGGGFSHLHKYTHEGEFVDSIAYATELCADPSTDYGPLDLDTDGEYLYGGIFSANGAGNVYRFLPDMSEVELLGNVGHSINALAYDPVNNYIYASLWGRVFTRLNIETSSFRQLNTDGFLGDISGLACMPMDEEGYTVWLLSQGSDANESLVYRYNPDTEQYDFWGTELYPESNPDPNSPDHYSSGGMSISNGFSQGRMDIATVLQASSDVIDVWEGYYSQTPWVYLAEDEQGGMINPNGQDRYVNIYFDVTSSHIGQQVDVSPGDEGIAELYFTGPDWVGFGPVDILVHFVDHVDVNENNSIVPEDYVLNKCYPNPFNSMTRVSINLPNNSNLKLSVSNILGQEVAVIHDGHINAGLQTFTYEASSLSAGIYFLKAYVPGKMNEVEKIVYMK